MIGSSCIDPPAIVRPAIFGSRDAGKGASVAAVGDRASAEDGSQPRSTTAATAQLLMKAATPLAGEGWSEGKPPRKMSGVAHIVPLAAGA